VTRSNDLPKIDSRAYRNTIGLFATGVTVVTTEVDGQVYGMTANAITSVSLEPLLVLVCVQKEAQIMPALRQSGSFAINILSENREDLSRYFANMWPELAPPPVSILPWLGGPRLADAIGALACKITEYLAGGDHWIVLGQVIDIYQAADPPNPLVYYRGQYRRVAD
jgi:flavin reductase (DIM6/NTAB) family NADH-FMN oxidoreductase RutF